MRVSLCFFLLLVGMSAASSNLFVSRGALDQVFLGPTAQIEAKIAATHPGPQSTSGGGGTVTFSSFSFDVLLQSFAFQPGGVAGWLYMQEFVQFNYHVQQSGFPWVSESGVIYIFTTNQNQKVIELEGTVDFGTAPPKLNASSATVGVQVGDLFIVGSCSDTVCLIPVSDIIDPIAAKLIPSIQTVLVQEANTAGNKLLAEISLSMRVKINSIWTLVLNNEGALSINNDGSLSYSATGIPQLQASGEPTVSPPQGDPFTLPPFDPGAMPHESFAFALDSYAVQSFIWALSYTGELNQTIAHAPPSSPIQLTTNNAFWKGAIPGLSAYPGLNLTVALSPLSMWSQASIVPAGIQLGPLTFAMGISIVNGTSVVSSNAVVVAVALNMTLAVNVTNVANEIQVQLSVASHSDSVSLRASKLGQVNLNAFTAILQFVFALAKIPPMKVAVPSSHILIGSVIASLNTGYIQVVAGINSVSASTPITTPLFSGSKGGKSIKSTPLVPSKSESLHFAVQPCGNGLGASCASNSTCCSLNMQTFQCCPLPHASCCSDGQHCCPEGTGCTNGNTQCSPWT